MASSRLILKLVAGNGHTIRGVVAPDGTQRFSVYDFINKSCGKSEDSSYGNTTFFRLTGDKSTYKNELLSLTQPMKFEGSGQRETPTMTLNGLQRLLMILGSKVAEDFRALVSDTFRRVMAGDQSLIEVINANAASDAHVQQAYRASLAEEPAAPVLDEMCLKRKRELEDLETAERREKLEESRENRRAKAIESTQKALDLLASLDPKGVDQRTKLQAADYVKNIMFTGCNNNMIANGNENASINVAVTATQMGFKCSPAQLQKIGRKMADKYREAYGEDPTKHTQYVNGNYVPVNSYTERDRALLEACIRDVMV